MTPKLIARTWMAAALALLVSTSTAAAANAPQRWVASWATSPEPADPDPDEPSLNIDGQTVRQRVRVSVGGRQVRVRLSNEYGATPLTIGAVTVAIPTDAAGIEAASLRPLTFDGRSAVTIPVGAPVLSDPVDLPLASGAEISISVYFPGRVTTPTWHALALKRAIITARGDFTRAIRVETQAVSQASILINAVLVPASPDQQLVVTFGDSVTDGDGSTLDADQSWPSHLARRLSTGNVAVVNAGIAGNRLLADGFGIKSLGASALTRFDRDVLALPGVTHVVLLHGLNDIGFSGATLGDRALADPSETRTPDDVIAAYRQLIARAHVQGVKIIGATLTPFEGVDVPGYYTPSKEAARRTVNHWIRHGGAFDSVIDFDAVLRDPLHPSRMQQRYASPDHLHPNDLGYRAMAAAIDLSIFQSVHANDAPVGAGRLFELAIYHAVPGKASALAARFRDASRLQAKHGLDVLAYWQPGGDPAWDNTFVYLVAHANRSAADRHWRAFHEDPDFQRYVQAEQVEPLIESVDSVYMRPTDYSELQ